MGEVLDDTRQAVRELFELANEDALGFPRVKLDGVEVDAVVSELTLDDVVAAGGTGENGGFTAIIKTFGPPDPPAIPAKMTPIEARGMALQVLEVRRNIAHAVITAGDPVPDQS